MQGMTRDVATKLSEVLNEELLFRMTQERFVKATRDLDAGLTILNYTARAQYENEWNAVTLACRGLIHDQNGNVIARPFAKFFNYAEELVSGLSGPIEVTEKLDGSLGILYQTGSEWRIATRGSFTSDQAVHATALWRERHSGFEPHEGWTYLFEIVYPANRIVVDYRGRDELVLLGAIEIATGRSVPLADAAKGWNGPVVQQHAYATLQEALEAEPRENAEGYVVRFVPSDVRVKIKHDEYVTLHKLVTGVSERRVWEVLAAGDTSGRLLQEWLEVVPDEMYQFVTTTRDRLLAEHAALVASIQTEHGTIVSELGADWTRRDLAAAVAASGHPLAKGVFSIADGKSVDGMVWGQLKPVEHIPWFQVED